MKAKVKVSREVDIKTLEIRAAVRYWEDAVINGVEDTEGNLTPFREGELWCPMIDIDSGVILNWPKGITADVHFKVCDAGSYFLKDKDGITVASIENDYVPNDLIPGDWGDYIKMQIDENGKILNWPTRPSLSNFFPEE